MKEQFNTLTMTRFGRMLVNVNDIYIGKSLTTYGEYSWAEIELLKQCLPFNGVVVEAGANIGSHTVPLAQIASQGGLVYAFEPQRIIFQTLCANIALNSCDNVFCYWGGLSDTDSQNITIPDLSPYVANNFGGIEANQQAGAEVPCMSVDKLNLKQCDILKIDVEGMEEAVIRGAERTIENCRPFIYFEADRREKLPAVINLVQSHNYKLWWHIPSLFNPLNYFSVENDIFRIISINILCVPAEKNKNINGLKPVSGENDWYN